MTKIENGQNRKWPKQKTAKIENDQNRKLPKQKITKIENDQNRKRSKWKMSKMENTQNGKRPKWKTDFKILNMFMCCMYIGGSCKQNEYHTEYGFGCHLRFFETILNFLEIKFSNKLLSKT